MPRARHLFPLLLSLVALSVAACGGDKASPKSAPGSPDNPLVAVTPAGSDEDSARARAGAPSASSVTKEPSSHGSAKPAAPSAAVAPDGVGAQPGYQKLVERQTSHPRSRFSPCNLVTEREARAIVGAPIQAPLEAPQGPTCIYRTQTGKRLIALAVQTSNFGKIKTQLRGRQQVTVSDRAAYCGTYGQPMLYLPLSHGRVLSVSAPCAVAQDFAVKALPHL